MYNLNLDTWYYYSNKKLIDLITNRQIYVEWSLVKVWCVTLI